MTYYVSCIFGYLAEYSKIKLFCCSLVGLVLLSGSSIAAVDTGTIKGSVRAVSVGGAAGQSSLVVGAEVTLTNKATPDRPMRAQSSGTGDFIFEGLPSGEYVLTVESNGLSKVTQNIKVEPGAQLEITIDLSATVSESVTIRDEEGLLSTSEVSTSNIVRTETLKNQPLRTDNFQNSIQFTPGAVRDGFGNDYIKGTRAGQSGYTVNGADITDPVTGQLAFDIPLEAASSVTVEENPYSANFGRFTGGVTNLQTKGGGEKFKFSAARLFPTFHNVFSTKIDSLRPRITLSGALVANKLFYLQWFEYRFSRIYVPSQLKPDNNQILEGFNSFTQIDWNVNKSNVVKFNAAIFPNRLRNFGLDTFNPATATPNYKQRGLLFSVSEQSVFKKASFLSSEVNYKTFDVDLFAKSSQNFNIAPETNSGGFFAETHRQTERLQWQETFYFMPIELFGRHSVKTGFDFYHTTIGGQLKYNPIFIRRSDNTLAQKISFTRATPLDYKYSEAAAFVQDRWVVGPSLTLDYGLRFDNDGVTKRRNVSPRFSFLLQPQTNGRTVIRGGIGIFYDRSLATAGYFDDQAEDISFDPTGIFKHVPRRIVTNYGADGTTIIDGPTFFRVRTDDDLRTPRNVRWSLQADRGITKNLTVRVGVMQRWTKNELLVDPSILSTGKGLLLLDSRGRSSYTEFQSLITYNNEKLGRWNAFYVNSHSRGDLNTADKYLGDTPSYVVRPNEYGKLPFDSPHRFLFYGQIRLFKKPDIRLDPVFETRSGFPFSKVNERLNFVGPRNEAGRFPTYVSLDIQATVGIKIPFMKDKRARVGIVLINATNHFNPRDVQANITSPNYGHFYNSLGTSTKAKFDLDF